MSAWTRDELDRIWRAEQLEVAPVRAGAAFSGGVLLTLIALCVTGLLARSAGAAAPRRRGPLRVGAALDEPAAV